MEKNWFERNGLQTAAIFFVVKALYPFYFQ